MDDPGWDFQCPGPEDDICMRSCTKSSNRGVGYQKKKKGTSRGDSSHPKGSPTTSKETSSVPALYSISSLCVSTISRSARIKGFS